MPPFAEGVISGALAQHDGRLIKLCLLFRILRYSEIAINLSGQLDSTGNVTLCCQVFMPDRCCVYKGPVTLGSYYLSCDRQIQFLGQIQNRIRLKKVGTGLRSCSQISADL